jgi:hypothetical protein
MNFSLFNLRPLNYLVAILALNVFISCNDPSSIIAKPLTEAELKAELKRKECDEPLKNMKGTLSYEPVFKNALSLKVKAVKLTFEVGNKATMATYKDLKVQVELLAKTGGVIVKETIELREFFRPGKITKITRDLNLSNQQFKEIASTEWTILSVKCD